MIMFILCTDGVDWHILEKTIPWMFSGIAWLLLDGLRIANMDIGRGPVTDTLIAGDA